MSRTTPEFSDNADQFGDGIEDQAFETQVEPTEADVTEATEPTEADAPETSTDEAQAEEDRHEQELQAFIAAADAAAEAADEDGHLNGDQLAPAVNAYRAITSGAKGKNKAKAYVADQMKAALTSGPDGYSKAMAWNSIQDSILSAPTKAAAEAKPVVKVDPSEAFAERVAALVIAQSLVEGNQPEDVDADKFQAALDRFVEQFQAEAEALYTYETSPQEEGAEAPQASPVAKAAVKLAQNKAVRKGAGRKSSAGGSTYAGPRRDVGKHILNAFADKASGTFLKISEIRAVRSDEYGDDAPSAGAVSARLFPASGKCTVEGITPGTDSAGNRGAYKA